MRSELSTPSRRHLGRPDPDPEMDASVAEILTSPEHLRAERLIREDDERTLREQIELASTPAPPFQEEERGRLMTRLLDASGATGIETDAVGNVRGWVGPPGPRPLVVSAHLDTVFPPDLPIRIRRDRGRWVGPGVCDDARGLAALLALVRAVSGTGGLTAPLLVVATVGEEGLGDLRGVRHLLSDDGDGEPVQARAFISLDGAGVRRIVSSGVGSRRFRVTVEGPGGHSWVDWGAVNPIQALSRGIHALSRLPLPRGATVNVGRIGGGTSVNAIPTRAWMEFELRSESEAELGLLEAEARAYLTQAVDASNGDRLSGSDAARTAIESIGRRPAGSTSPHSVLVRAAVAATRSVAGGAELAASSTDANFPMSQGIPAVTLGAGGEAGMAHTPDEWYRNVQGPEGVIRALRTLRVLDRYV